MRTTLSKLVNTVESIRMKNLCVDVDASLTTAVVSTIWASHNSILMVRVELAGLAQSESVVLCEATKKKFFFSGDKNRVTGWYKLFIFIYVVVVVSNFIIAFRSLEFIHSTWTIIDAFFSFFEMEWEWDESQEPTECNWNSLNSRAATARLSPEIFKTDNQKIF